MSLFYSSINNNDHRLQRVLILDKTNSSKLKGYKNGRYHPALFRVVAGYDGQKNTAVSIDESEWILTAGGFVMSAREYKELEFAEVAPVNDILGLASNDRMAAIDLLQHLIIVFRPEIPEFVAVTPHKVMVSQEAVQHMEEASNIVCTNLTNGKGYRFSAILPDGFILAEYSASTLIPANNDLNAIQKFAVQNCRNAATEKLWELLGWEMRQWMMAMLLKPLHTVLPIDLYGPKSEEKPFQYSAPVMTGLGGGL